MKLNKKSKMFLCLATSLVFFSQFFSGCLSEDIEYVDGNIGKIQVMADTQQVKVLDYLVETLIFNDSSKTIEAYEGIKFNENVISYKITGNVQSISAEEITKVSLKIRYFGGVSKGIFILNETIQEKYYVDPNETWDFDVRFKDNDPKFTRLEFFDIIIYAEM